MPVRQTLSRLWDSAFYVVLITAQRTRLYRRVAQRLHPPFVVPEAGPEDMRAVAAWLEALDTEEAAGPCPFARNYVARSLGRVIGFAQLANYRDKAGPYTGFWLCSLRVRIGWRGVGVGEALARRCIDDARDMGASCISLIVYSDNTPAMGLDRKLGFEQRSCPELDAEFKREAATSGRSRIIMSRAL